MGMNTISTDKSRSRADSSASVLSIRHAKDTNSDSSADGVPEEFDGEYVITQESGSAVTRSPKTVGRNSQRTLATIDTTHTGQIDMDEELAAALESEVRLEVGPERG